MRLTQTNILQKHLIRFWFNSEDLETSYKSSYNFDKMTMQQYLLILSRLHLLCLTASLHKTGNLPIMIIE